MELVVAPDIENLLISHLAAMLAAAGSPVPVSGQVPSPRPDSCVVVYRTGGHMRTRVTDSALINIDCRAPLAKDAAVLANLVRALLLAVDGDMIGGYQIVRVRNSGGPSNLPDPSTPGQIRYRLLMEIDVTTEIRKVN